MNIIYKSAIDLIAENKKSPENILYVVFCDKAITKETFKEYGDIKDEDAIEMLLPDMIIGINFLLVFNYMNEIGANWSFFDYDVKNKNFKTIEDLKLNG